jgi:hypothetical protein
MFPGNPRGRQAVEISVAFTALAFVILALRLYTRFFIVRCAGIEDYGIVLAMVGKPLKSYVPWANTSLGLLHWPNDIHRFPYVYVCETEVRC